MQCINIISVPELDLLVTDYTKVELHVIMILYEANHNL